MPRFYCPVPLKVGMSVELPADATRHVQVLRLQPGDSLTLFNGLQDDSGSGGGEFDATISHMGRREVRVDVHTHRSIERESTRVVHLALGIPANERMDWLVEKAAELGVTSIQPLLTHRSIVRLQGERGLRKVEHWQSIAVSACEQCGRNAVPRVHGILPFEHWLNGRTHRNGLVLSLSPSALPLRTYAATADSLYLLSGPEGGLTGEEEALAFACGYRAASLGPRTLRAETAPLAALCAITLGL